jgi:hypothetical protein
MAKTTKMCGLIMNLHARKALCSHNFVVSGLTRTLSGIVVGVSRASHSYPKPYTAAVGSVTQDRKPVIGSLASSNGLCTRDNCHLLSGSNNTTGGKLGEFKPRPECARIPDIQTTSRPIGSVSSAEVIFVTARMQSTSTPSQPNASKYEQLKTSHA